MDNKPQDASSDTILSGNNVPQGHAVPPPPANPWEGYLVGKKVPARRFLAKLAKGAIPVPDQQVLDHFADAIVAKPVRLGRVTELLEASAAAGETMQRIACDLANASVHRFGVPPLANDADAATFREWVFSWVAGIQKKPLTPINLSILLLLLRLGRQRGLLECETALDLMSLAACKPKKSGVNRARHVEDKTPLDVLLEAPPTALALVALVTHSRAWEKQFDELNGQLRSGAERVEHLTTDRTNLEAAIARLRDEISSLEDRRKGDENKVAELEKRIVELGDGWQHKLEEVRGRMRGVMQGQLTRWLQTALDAARSHPPFVKAIEERLEDALRTLDGELQWLQHSD